VTPFWRRERPLHERLAEEGGLTVPLEPGRDVAPWHQAGVHGLARPRQWDAVVTAEADLPGDSVSFVALEDGTLLVEENVPDDALSPLADAVELQIAGPYRALATRKSETVWAVAANKIVVAELTDEIGGDTVELAVQGDERTVLVDGAPSFGALPSLEALAAGLPAYVVRADRIDGDLWDVKVVPL
jgi:hypothetical protein